MNEFAKIFKALSDANRLRILKILERKSLCVCEITNILGLSASTVSAHLSVLKEVGFIHDSKDGKWVNYSISKFSNDIIVNQILAMFPLWMNENDQIREDRIKAELANRIELCNININSTGD